MAIRFVHVILYLNMSLFPHSLFPNLSPSDSVSVSIESTGVLLASWIVSPPLVPFWTVLTQVVETVDVAVTCGTPCNKPPVILSSVNKHVLVKDDACGSRPFRRFHLVFYLGFGFTTFGDPCEENKIITDCVLNGILKCTI